MSQTLHSFFFTRQNEDIISIALHFLDDSTIAHLKLSHSHFYSLITTLVPIQHFVSILFHIKDRNYPLPILHIPNDFIFKREQVENIKTFFTQKDTSLLPNLITKFVLHYYLHAIFCEQLLCQFPFNHVFLLAWCQKTSINAPFVQRMREWNRLLSIVKSEPHGPLNRNTFAVNMQWTKEHHWRLLPPKVCLMSLMLPTPADSFGSITEKVSFMIPTSVELYDCIIANESLLLFLLHIKRSIRLNNAYEISFIQYLISSTQWKDTYCHKLEFKKAFITGLENLSIEMMTEAHIDCQHLSAKEILELVQQNSILYKLLDQKWRQNKRITLEAVQLNGTLIVHAHKSLQQDKEVIIQSLKSGGYDEEFMKKTITTFKTDTDFLTQILAYVDWDLLKKFPLKIRNNKQVLLKAISLSKSKTCVLDYLMDTPLINDKDICLAAVKKNGLSFLRVPVHLAKEEEIYVAAMKQDGFVMRYIPKDIVRTREMAKIAVQFNGHGLGALSDPMQDDFELVSLSVATSPSTIRFASARIQNDRNYVLELVRMNGRCILYLPDEFKNDNELLCIAIAQNGMVLNDEKLLESSSLFNACLQFYETTDDAVL